MPNLQFPPEFKYYWKDPNTKAAFVSEPLPRHPSDCRNCGGLGTMFTFIAQTGPFDNPPVGKDIVAHWGSGKWWGGKNYTAHCPICKGTGKNTEYKSPPIRVNPIRTKQATESLGKLDAGTTEYIEEMEAAEA